MFLRSKNFTWASNNKLVLDPAVLKMANTGSDGKVGHPSVIEGKHGFGLDWKKRETGGQGRVGVCVCVWVGGVGVAFLYPPLWATYR